MSVAIAHSEEPTQEHVNTASNRLGKGQSQAPAKSKSRVSRAYEQSRGGDEEPPWDMVEKYLPLVKSIVGKMHSSFPSKIDSDDLYSIGVKGLITAISRFDRSKQKSFGSYAILRIRGAILDELRRIDCMPRSNRAKAKELRETVNELEAGLKRPATEDEVRERLGMSQREYANLMQQVQPITHVPLDMTPGEDEGNGPAVSDAVSDPTEMNSREVAENREMFELLRGRIKELAETPQKVLVMYYYEGMNFAEIGRVLHLTESRICQIHSQAVISLRSYLTGAMQR
jgi:RNA polymerase sigma factor for flagellar operon FliA